MEELKKIANTYKKQYMGITGTITIYSNKLSLLERLDLYLDRFFYTERTYEEYEDKDISIYVIIDDDVFDKWLNSDESNLNDSKRIIEQSGSITVPSCGGNVRYHIASNSINNLGFVQDIYCYIRRSIISDLQNKMGAAVLHGAGVSHNNEGILVLGDKGYGKSYITDCLVLFDDCDFLAFDQAVVYIDHNGKIRCRSNITSYRVDMLDSVFDENDGYKKLKKYVEAMEKNEFTVKKNKINIPPDILCISINKQLVKDIELSKIIILTDPDYDKGFRKVSSDEKKDLLRRYLVDELKDSAFKADLDKQEKCLRIIEEQCEIITVTKRPQLNIIQNLL